MIRTLAVPLALLALAAVPAAGASSSHTLQFISVQKQFTVTPQGDPTVGSRLIFADAIYNRVPQFGKPAGARVGRVEVVCTIVTMGSAQCMVTAHLPSGQIVAAGGMVLKEGRATNRFAITGGAGAYATARGTVLSRDVSPTKSIVTLQLAG